MNVQDMLIFVLVMAVIFFIIAMLLGVSIVSALALAALIIIVGVVAVVYSGWKRNEGSYTLVGSLWILSAIYLFLYTMRNIARDTVSYECERDKQISGSLIYSNPL